MRKNKAKVLVSVALAAAMTTGCAGTTEKTKYPGQGVGAGQVTSETGSTENVRKDGGTDAESGEDTSGAVSGQVSGKDTNRSNQGQVTKNETVYIKTDGEGKPTSVVVSDQLRNIQSLSSIQDISELTEIENVKGDEAFSQEEKSLSWENDGSDEICYQGTSEKELPIGVSISYSLDGKELTPEELEGKSGHLKMTVTYTNRTTGENYVPFAMATVLMGKQENCSNITIDHGKLFSDGEREIIVGFGVPGMKAYLEDGRESSLIDLEIPEDFTVEMDVKNYSKLTCMTMASNDMFSDMTTDQIDSLDELQDSVEKFSDGAAQLMDGTKKLKDGTGSLLSASGELADGVKKLADGGSSLADGTARLEQGARELNAGAGALADGTSQLSSGSKALMDGAGQVSDGATSAKNGAAQLDSGLAAMQQGVENMQSQVGDGISRLDAGAGSLSDGLAQAGEGASMLANGLSLASSGSTELKNGISQAKSGVDGMAQLAGAVAMTIPDRVTTDEVEVSVHVDNSDLQAAVEAQLAEYGLSEEQIAEVSGLISDKDVVTTTTATVDLTEEMAAAQGYCAKLSATASQVSEGMSMLEDGAEKLDSSMSDLAGGASTLSIALSESGELRQGAVMLQGGIESMGQSLGTGTSDMLSGLGQLKNGSSQLSDGLASLEYGASQVSDGAKSLHIGIDTVSNGANALYSGTGTFVDGVSAVNSGAGELKAGLDSLNGGTGSLIEGVKALNDGAIQLDSGMVQFNEEGVQKLTDLFDGDIDTLFDKLNAMVDNSKKYNNYSGISEKMEGTVKFIFISEM